MDASSRSSSSSKKNKVAVLEAVVVSSYYSSLGRKLSRPDDCFIESDNFEGNRITKKANIVCNTSGVMGIIRTSSIKSTT